MLPEDPLIQAKWDGWLHSEATELALWGTSMRRIEERKQPIAACEAPKVPLALLQWPGKARNRKIAWYVDNTSAMASMVKEAAAIQYLERIIGIYLDDRISSTGRRVVRQGGPRIDTRRQEALLRRVRDRIAYTRTLEAAEAAVPLRDAAEAEEALQAAGPEARREDFARIQ